MQRAFLTHLLVSAGCACTLGIGQFLTICGNYVSTTHKADLPVYTFTPLSFSPHQYAGTNLIQRCPRSKSKSDVEYAMCLQGVNFAACYTCHTREKFRRRDTPLTSLDSMAV